MKEKKLEHPKTRKPENLKKKMKKNQKKFGASTRMITTWRTHDTDDPNKEMMSSDFDPGSKTRYLLSIKVTWDMYPNAVESCSSSVSWG